MVLRCYQLRMPGALTWADPTDISLIKANDVAGLTLVVLIMIAGCTSATIMIRSDQISRSVVSDSLRPHEPQHDRTLKKQGWFFQTLFFQSSVGCQAHCRLPGSSVHGILQARMLE